MIDHLTLHVRDVARSVAFYSAALEPLCYMVKAHHEPTLGLGARDGTAHADFYLSPAPGGAYPRRRTSPSARVTGHRSGLSTGPHSPPAAPTTGPLVHARTIRDITRRSCSTPTATTSRR